LGRPAATLGALDQDRCAATFLRVEKPLVKPAVKHLDERQMNGAPRQVFVKSQ
jgi:hypothetical protein